MTAVNTEITPGDWITYSPMWSEERFLAVFLQSDDQRPDRVWIQPGGKRSGYPIAIYAGQMLSTDSSHEDLYG